MSPARFTQELGGDCSFGACADGPSTTPRAVVEGRPLRICRECIDVARQLMDDVRANTSAPSPPLPPSTPKTPEGREQFLRELETTLAAGHGDTRIVEAHRGRLGGAELAQLLRERVCSFCDAQEKTPYDLMPSMKLRSTFICEACLGAARAVT